MCGVAGIFAVSADRPRAELEAAVTRMAGQLTHRGPDSSGAWVDETAGVALAHRRLAILDLSPEGAQPMCSASGRFVVTFNGEIYNHIELGRDLARLGHAFRGHSDTEVLLAAVEQWGVEGALSRANGMFALAAWDARERRLHLARDRMGEKPLYYGWFGDLFLFGSEVKALRAHPAFNAAIDRNALALFLRHSYIPAPYSIFVGLRKLPPGTVLSVSAQTRGETRIGSYWSHARVAADARARPFQGSTLDAVDRLDALLRDAVRLRMHADVPLGAFLSGGIDSSTIVALMQAQSARPVQTFTIGFFEQPYDEARHAKRVARHLGTDHTELYLDAQDALGVIPKLPALYDEPFADPSQVPTYLLCALARRHVTVSLSGDGGDELFCGYSRYARCAGMWHSVRWIPASLRAITGEAVRSLDRIAPAALRRLPAARRGRAAADMFRLRTGRAMYHRLVSHWRDTPDLALGAQEPPTPLTDPAGAPELDTFLDEMMFLDAVTYLPDDILVKLDRASMGVSLEARVPFLDPRVVELAWSFPVDLKRRNRTGKWVLRQVLDRYVPRSLVERPKMGFGVPIDSWLRGPLRDWAQDLLSEERLRREGLLDPAPIMAKLRAHLSGARDEQFELWDVLMFQGWLASHGAADAAPTGQLRTG